MQPEPGKWLWLFLLGGNRTCGTSGWRVGRGRGQTWGQLEVPKHLAFLAHMLCIPLCFPARMSMARRYCSCCWGVFPRIVVWLQPGCRGLFEDLAVSHDWDSFFGVKSWILFLIFIF